MTDRPMPSTDIHGCRVSRAQLLALAAIQFGQVDANPRTLNCLVDRGMIVFLGPFGSNPHGRRRDYRLTSKGEAALARAQAGGA